jgi:hypothetical protein
LRHQAINGFFRHAQQGGGLFDPKFHECSVIPSTIFKAGQLWTKPPICAVA